MQLKLVWFNTETPNLNAINIPLDYLSPHNTLLISDFNDTSQNVNIVFRMIC